jgi:hypothetical protein
MGIMGSLRISPRSRESLGSFGSLLVATCVLLLTNAGELRLEEAASQAQNSGTGVHGPPAGHCLMLDCLQGLSFVRSFPERMRLLSITAAVLFPSL